MAKKGKGVEHNRLLLCYNMMKSGLNVMEAWRRAGEKIKRSQAAKRGAMKRMKTPVTIWED